MVRSQSAEIRLASSRPWSAERRRLEARRVLRTELESAPSSTARRVQDAYRDAAAGRWGSICTESSQKSSAHEQRPLDFMRAHRALKSVSLSTTSPSSGFPVEWS